MGGFTVPPAQYADPEPLISPDFNGWWTRGMAIVKAGWRPIVLVQSLGALVSFGMTAGVALFSLFHPPLSPAEDATPNQVLGIVLPWIGMALAGVALAGLVSLLVTLTTAHLSIQVAAGGRGEVGPALGAAGRRLFPLLGWGLVSGLITVAGACACILPAFYFMAVFTVLAPVVLIERGAAVNRCFRLFHGNLGASVARVAMIFVLNIGASVVGSAVSTGISRGIDGVTGRMSLQVVALLVATFFQTVIGAGAGVLVGPLTVLTYADERARIEPVRSADLINEVLPGYRSATVPE
jgi:hypothetical protein